MRGIPRKGLTDRRNREIQMQSVFSVAWGTFLYLPTSIHALCF